MNTSFLKKLTEASAIINAFQPKEGIYDTVCRLAIKIFGVDLVWLALVTEESDPPLPVSGESLAVYSRRNLRFVWGHFLNRQNPDNFSVLPLELDIADSLLYPDEQVLIKDQGTCWIINNIKAHGRFPEWRDKALQQGFQAFICIPLVGRKGDILGTVHFYSKKKGIFTDEFIEVIRIYFGMAVSTIEVRRLVDGLEDKVEELETAKEENVQSEIRYRHLFASMRDAVVITDHSRTIVDVNQPALREIFGYETEELIGKSAAILYAERDGFELVGIEVYDHQEAGVGKLLEMRFRHKSGAVFDGEIYALKMRGDDGRPVANFGIIRDISARKQLESQYLHAQRMESVGRLAGGVAHDFNNMLSVILGYSEMALTKTEPTDVRHEELQEVIGAAKRSADIVRQLLVFARKQKTTVRVLDLNETVEAMLKMLRRLIGEDINLTWRPSVQRLTILSDPAQIDQILANLCVNARDAIKGVGNLIIETSTALFDDKYCRHHVGAVPGMYAMLTVTDDGCGMTHEIRDKIFEPFFTTKEAGRGTGLGLAIVYGIVKQSHGYIDVDSEPGRETTIKVYLPQCFEQAVATVAEGKSSAPTGQGETILVVEDEETILRVTAVMLKNHGYKALTANSPQQAKRLAEEHGEGIALLLTDVIMPEMNGRELANALLATHPKLKCLFMSGYTESFIAEQGGIDEGTNFIGKPFSAVDLAVKVHEILAA